MIARPTVKELLEHAENRYELVIATSRRARQIAKGDTVLIDAQDRSPVTIAAKEIAEGKVSICGRENNTETESIDVDESDESVEEDKDVSKNIEE